LHPLTGFRNLIRRLPQLCPHSTFNDSVFALCSCVISHKLVEREEGKPQRSERRDLVNASRRGWHYVKSPKKVTPARRLREDRREAFWWPKNLPRRAFTISFHAQSQIRDSLEEANQSYRPTHFSPALALKARSTRRSWTPSSHKSKPIPQRPSFHTHERDPNFSKCKSCNVDRQNAPTSLHHTATEEVAMTAGASCGRCAGIRCCLFCPTEVHVSAETLPKNGELAKSKLKLKIETWKDFGSEWEAHDFSRPFLSMRTEPKVERAGYDRFDPTAPYLYPCGSLEKFFDPAAQTEQGKQGTKARGFDVELDMKPAPQDVRLPPNLTRYI
jgi:hypothetical protein